MITSSKISNTPCFAVISRIDLQEVIRERDRCPGGTAWLQDDGRHVALNESLLQHRRVIGWEHGHGSERLARDTGYGGRFEGRFFALQRIVLPAVEMALELQDRVALGVTPGNPHREQGRFGARCGEADALRRRHQLDDLFGPFDFAEMAGREVGSARDLVAHRLIDVRVVVAQDQGAVADGVVDQLVAVDIPLVRAVGVGDVRWERLDVPAIVGDSADDGVAGTLMHGSRAGELGLVP